MGAGKSHIPRWGSSCDPYWRGTLSRGAPGPPRALSKPTHRALRGNVHAQAQELGGRRRDGAEGALVGGPRHAARRAAGAASWAGWPGMRCWPRRRRRRGAPRDQAAAEVAGGRRQGPGVGGLLRRAAHSPGAPLPPARRQGVSSQHLPATLTSRSTCPPRNRPSVPFARPPGPSAPATVRCSLLRGRSCQSQPLKRACRCVVHAWALGAGQTFGC
jgi:hypothetical protein